MSDFAKVEDEFRAALEARGIIAPANLIADGQIHHLPTHDKPKSKNGRYTLQPTDRVVFKDPSFTEWLGFPRGLKRQEDTYSAEVEQPLRTQGMSRADSRRAFKEAIKGETPE